MKNKAFKIAVFLFASGFSSMAGGQTVISQDERNRELSVNTRTNPSYDPYGKQVGAFTLFPSLQTGASYIDNVFYSRRNRQPDVIYSVAPDFNFLSNFQRHQLLFDVHGNEGAYQDHKSEDFFDYGATVGGRLDVGADTAVPFGLNYDRSHQSRGSPDDRFGLKPRKYDTVGGRTGLNYSNHFFSAGWNGSASHITFDPSKAGQGFIDNRDRNRDQFDNYFKFGILPEGYVTPFAYARYGQNSYTHRKQSDNRNRDSQEVEGGIGTQVALSNITQSTASVGVTQRRFDDKNFSTITSPSFALALAWEPSTLTAFTLSGQRSINETGLADFSARIDSILRLAAKYELSPNALVEPDVQFLNSKYRGEAHSKVDQWTTGGKVTYKLNRNVWAILNYTHFYEEDKIHTDARLGNVTNDVIGFTIKFQE